MMTDGILLDSMLRIEDEVLRAHDQLGARIFVVGVGNGLDSDQVLT
jgi:hypothetical protein